MKPGHANPQIDGPALRELRKLAGYNITQLAAEIGCSVQYLSQLEVTARKGCSPALFVRIVKALELDDPNLIIRSDEDAAA